jgi:CPA2 family monovalent cation:H+ antiporter-2
LIASLAQDSAAHPAFFSEVAVLLLATAVVTYVAARLGIMPIVAFLLTGALIGPHALGLVHNEALIEAAAEIGVILLLFTIGIEFSLAKLAQIQRIIIVGGGLQVGLVIAIVTGVLAALGVGWRAGVFTGCLVALSSTAIVMKLLMDRGEVSTDTGQASLGILIFQDLAVVAMVLVVPMLGGTISSGAEIAVALGKAAVIVAVVLVAARRIMPVVLEAVARTCSQEIFLLTIVAICFGTAYLTSLAGVSLSLGAFLAGLVVSESRYSQMAVGEILPLQILFSATFFVSVGLLFDAGFLMEQPLLVLGVVVAVFTVKLVTTGAGMLALGYGAGTAASAALLLGQVGEFSFVLERTGRQAGLFPAGLESGGPETFIAATVVLMIATPFLTPVRAALGGTARPRAPQPEPESLSHPAAEHQAELRDHVIIAGLGEAASQLAPLLDEAEIPFVIVTLSPQAAQDAEDAERTVIRGNYGRRHELQRAGLQAARMLVVADDEPEMIVQVTETARALRSDLPILVRARAPADPFELREAGATEVVSDLNESVIRLLTRVMDEYGLTDAAVSTHLRALRASAAPVTARSSRNGSIRLTDRQRTTEDCRHVDATTAVIPSAEGCQECLRMGKRGWVHLRVCMTCGFVGCCDSSPGTHARKHHEASGHPIIRSIEPGESWAWCYVDEQFL